jgi:hypothetical protein
MARPKSQVDATTPQEQKSAETTQQVLTTSVLIKLQQELKAPKGNFNSFGKYKYRSAEDILEALKPLLAKYHSVLLLQDEVKEIAGTPFVCCTAQLITPIGVFQTTSNAAITLNKKGMDDSQSTGSSVSYARKYALGGLFLLDDTKDSDATNTHDKVEPELPELKDENFSKLVARYNGGEKDIFQKASKHYSFTQPQQSIINKLNNNQ